MSGKVLAKTAKTAKTLERLRIQVEKAYGTLEGVIDEAHTRVLGPKVVSILNGAEYALDTVCFSLSEAINTMEQEGQP